MPTLTVVLISQFTGGCPSRCTDHSQVSNRRPTFTLFTKCWLVVTRLGRYVTAGQSLCSSFHALAPLNFALILIDTTSRTEKLHWQTFFVNKHVNHSYWSNPDFFSQRLWPRFFPHWRGLWSESVEGLGLFSDHRWPNKASAQRRSCPRSDLLNLLPPPRWNVHCVLCRTWTTGPAIGTTAHISPKPSYVRQARRYRRWYRLRSHKPHKNVSII